MNKQESASIYVITYLTTEERCGILRRTCESALAQNYPDFEVVVSDNGGPISAVDALAEIKDPRLKVFRHTENVGFSGNMNRCLDLCSHDIIKPLCDDDLIHPDFLAFTVPIVDDQTLVMTDLVKFFVGSDPAGIFQPATVSPQSECRPAGYREDIWSLSYSFLPSAMLFTRRCFQDLGGFDSKCITADWDFFIESCLHKNVVHLMCELCYVGVWGGSLTEEMMEKPYFFPFEGLYTKFRVFHSKSLSPADRRRMRAMLWKEWAFQSLRLIKHPFESNYWKGCASYTGRFFKLLSPANDTFTLRPN